MLNEWFIDMRLRSANLKLIIVMQFVRTTHQQLIFVQTVVICSQYHQSGEHSPLKGELWYIYYVLIWLLIA